MNAWSQPPSDACPRCGGGFHCGANDATPCPCGTVSLDAATAAALRAGYVGCLCLACLVELKALEPNAAGPMAQDASAT